jgi:hypothetical protein
MKPGGTEGGTPSFLMGGGVILLAVGLYLLLDSVRVVTGDFGAISGMMHGRGGVGETTSMGIVFIPFLIGAGVLFFDMRKRWAWVLSGVGLLVLVIEILSRIRFRMDTKVSHLLMILVMIAAGAGLLARAYLTRNVAADQDGGKPEQANDE